MILVGYAKLWKLSKETDGVLNWKVKAMCRGAEMVRENREWFLILKSFSLRHHYISSIEIQATAGNAVLESRWLEDQKYMFVNHCIECSGRSKGFPRHGVEGKKEQSWRQLTEGFLYLRSWGERMINNLSES